MDGTAVEPFRFAAIASKSHCEIAGELAAEIKQVIHQHDGVPLALILGVLRVIESDLIQEAR